VNPVLVGMLLFMSGIVLTVVGGVRGYAHARRALAPLIHEGEATRARLESMRPLPMRPKVRAFASRVVLSVAWLGLSFYGLYLAVAGVEWMR
jgi:hypothetical protein